MTHNKSPMRYINYVIYKNEKQLIAFLKFYFNVGYTKECTNNMSGVPRLFNGG